MDDFKLKNGSGRLCCGGCGRQNNKLNTYDWLADIPGNAEEQDMVEVQFKNTRKGYYKNSNGLHLEKGDIVAVEASPGHDIGTVTLTGRLVPLQMRKANLKPDAEIRRIYRKVKPVDMEKYEEAKSREHDTMIRSRKIAESLGLQMKIGDVEYQGDGNKAIFYYIADERVDFRQLIKVLAETFRVRIEMKQIGARQEAGRIGGIGPCGRELCCATWMTNFVSVSTSAARFQDISLNPQKLAGQCAKLKCCLNYEVDAYVECQKRLPSKEITLETLDNMYYYFKADILKGTITYSTDKSFLANEVTISARRAFEVLNMNKRGEKPEKLDDEFSGRESQRSKDLLEQESLTRFDKTKGGKNRKRNKKGRHHKTMRQRLLKQVMDKLQTFLRRKKIKDRKEEITVHRDRKGIRLRQLHRLQRLKMPEMHHRQKPVRNLALTATDGEISVGITRETNVRSVIQIRMYRLKESFIYYIKAGLALCVLFLLNACHTDTRYHVYQAVSGEEGWDKSDSLAFHLPVGLSSGEYRMEIGLRHTGEYSYRDIWLSVTQSEGDSIPPRTDTLHIYLTDEKGHWVQSGAMGGLYQHVYVSDKPVIFSTDSIDRIFRITHLMRQNPLPGISDVGIRLFLPGRVNAEEDKQQDGKSPQ